MNWLLDNLAGLPSSLVYPVIGFLGFVENIFPPVPADTAIALGAFLSLRGVVTLWGVFGVTIVLNLAGAMTIYHLAARHSSTLFSSRLAQRLLPANGVEFVQREYQRFGLTGLFIARLLPGFRAIVPPFAGLIHLGAWRTGLVLGLASSLWYGGIIWLVGRIGRHWDQITLLLQRTNLVLGVMAALILLALFIWIRIRRGRQ